MIAYLEELMAKLFGARDNVAIPVRAEEEKRPIDRQLEGRR